MYICLVCAEFSVLKMLDNLLLLKIKICTYSDFVNFDRGLLGCQRDLVEGVIVFPHSNFIVLIKQPVIV